MTNTPEFKVGDLVYYHDQSCHGSGKEGTITDINEYGRYGVDWADIGPVGEYNGSELILVEDGIVEKPSHYTRWVIEPITFIMRNGFEFWRGNIVKYASRAGFKKYEDMTEVESEITDLKKVIRYAEMRINQLNGEAEL